jgi:hypothetical protein
MQIEKKVHFLDKKLNSSFTFPFVASLGLMQKATQLKLRLHMQQQQQRSLNDTAQEKRLMYEDRIQIFNSEANRPTPQRGSFQSSKSIDTDSPHLYQTPITTKAYESMTDLAHKLPGVKPGLKEKTLSRPRIPMIRDKSVPNTPYLNPSLSRRTTTAGQHRIELDKAKLKSFEEKYKKNVNKRGKKSKSFFISYEVCFYRTIGNTR